MCYHHLASQVPLTKKSYKVCHNIDFLIRSVSEMKAHGRVCMRMNAFQYYKHEYAPFSSELWLQKSVLWGFGFVEAGTLCSPD